MIGDRGRVLELGRVLVALTILGFGMTTYAEERSYSRAAAFEIPRQLLWGDTHVHSSLSLDANLSGNTFGPEFAYRFARGETVIAHNGMPVRLRRPLDFLVVADHAEYVGVMDGLRRGDELLLENATARRWGKGLAAGDTAPLGEFAESLSVGVSVLDHPAFARTVWDRMLAAAEKFNDPGSFTALIGYEWTSAPGGQNLHRVVLFRDDAERAGAMLPFTAFDSNDPEDLWAHLARYQEATGGRAMAIPHNGNLSGGAMFTDVTRDGSPIDAAYARKRATFEPLVEVTQVKGDGETHPFLSPDDEFADYETWDQSDVSLVNPHQDDWYRHEYARSALELGLRLEQRLGVNPFRFGMIGSTDSHTGLATAEEDNFWGKFAQAEPSPERWRRPMVAAPLPYMTYEWQMAASGYAAVWATGNTREAVFDALDRREAYATTGPRITVRFFGGWDFPPDAVHRPDFAETGYRQGVPMGGVLGPLSASAGSTVAPRFLVSALKDPDGANLDRVQIVKGWIDEEGEVREQVYDVAVSDGREAGYGGQVPPLESTVEVPSATYTNSVGAAELSAWWRDPAFDPALPAFYYVRVLEIETPRWTAFDAAYFDLSLPDEVPMTTRERAYTSPIWYSPSPPAGGASP